MNYNTIFQTDEFNKEYKKIKIEDNYYYINIHKNEIELNFTMVSINYCQEKIINFLFKTYPKINTIIIKNAILTNKQNNNSILELSSISNFQLLLPVTINEYTSSLGKKTRMHLGQYQRHIEKEITNNGGGYYSIPISQESKNIFNSIIDLNHERCSSKGIVAGTEKESLYKKLVGYGIINYIKVGNKIIAGTISSVYNGQLNLHVIAHDNSYNKYNPGNVILLKTIEYAINQNISVFNFLWGACEYKKRFLANEVFMYDYYICRNKFILFNTKIKLLNKHIINKIKSIIISIEVFFYRLLRYIYHHTLKRQQKSLGYIFMLHRVDEYEDGHLWCNEHMKVAPNFLDQKLSEIKEKFDIISLEEVPSRLKNKQKRKFVVFTMDDGYKDNFTKALPVFKKHNVPYTIFVTTDFPDNKAVLWWYELEDLLLNNQTVTLSNGITYPANNYEEKCNSFLQIREEILSLDQLDLENQLNKLFANYKINWTSKCDSLCLSWDDIKQLKKESLVTIGAHTMHHYNLKALKTEEDVKNEVLEGTKRLKEMADIEPIVFAYPFGSENEAGEREFQVLEKLPFICSCIACGSACTKKNKNTKSALPRYMFNKDFNIKDLK